MRNGHACPKMPFIICALFLFLSISRALVRVAKSRRPSVRCSFEQSVTSFRVDMVAEQSRRASFVFFSNRNKRAYKYQECRTKCRKCRIKYRAIIVPISIAEPLFVGRVSSVAVRTRRKLGLCSRSWRQSSS